MDSTGSSEPDDSAAEVLEDLETLVELRDSGDLSDDQFEVAKNQLLGLTSAEAEGLADQEDIHQHALDPPVDHQPTPFTTASAQPAPKEIAVRSSRPANWWKWIVLGVIAVAVAIPLLAALSQRQNDGTQLGTCLESARGVVRTWNSVSGRVLGAYSNAELSADEYLAVHDENLPEMVNLVAELKRISCDEIEGWPEFGAIYDDRLTVYISLANATRIGSPELEEDALRMADAVTRRADTWICSLDPDMGAMLNSELGLDRC